MKVKNDEITHRLYVLIRLDSKRLFERITKREKEYLYTFSLQRKRDHFPEIFDNRFDEVTIDLLKNLSEEVNVALDNFYSLIDDMYWYLMHTQDMGNTIEDKLSVMIHKLRGIYSTLNLFVDAELNGEPLGEAGFNELEEDYSSGEKRFSS